MDHSAPRVALLLSVVSCIAVFSVHNRETTVKLTKDSSGVVDAIVNLKSYCVAAHPLLDKISELKDSPDCGQQGKPKCLRSGALALVEAFGKPSKTTDLVTEYAKVIGNLKAAHPTGMGSYLIDNINENILKGQSVIKTDKAKYTLDNELLGLRDIPHYFHKLMVGTVHFASAKASLHEGDPGQAIIAWATSGKAEAYDQFYSKIKAKYLQQQQEQDLLEEEASKAAIKASFEEAERAGHSKNDLVLPTPSAAVKGANSVLVSSNWVMPPEEQIRREAMEEAKKYMTVIAERNAEPAQVIEMIESTLKGTTVEVETSAEMGSESNLSPKIKIVGSAADINGVFNALPLNGKKMKQTFETTSGVSVGRVKEIQLWFDNSDKNFKNNPWWCKKVTVQVGHGNPVIEFVPKTETADQARPGFWLDGSAEGKDGPYFGVAKNTKWTLIPKQH